MSGFDAEYSLSKQCTNGSLSPVGIVPAVLAKEQSY